VRNRSLFVVLALLLVCSTLVPDSRAAFLSPEEETELGRRFLASVQSQYEFADNPYVTGYIKDIGTYIGRQVEVPYFPLNFYVIKDGDINAFAAPAGHVFFFSGLIGILESVDELASVLAHELGHVSARHLASRIERSQKIGFATMAGMLAAVLVGGKAAGAIMTGSVAAGIQAELGYTREDERQADQLGFKYAHLAGFNPAGMLTVLQKIQRERWYSAQEIPPYLLTHPGAPERMANLEAMLQGYKKTPDSEDTEQLRSRFPIFRTMVVALCYNEEDATREFKRMLEVNSQSALAHYGLGLIMERQGDIREALGHFKSALRHDPDCIPIAFSLAKAYQTIGQYEDSLAILRKAHERSPKDKEILYLLALSLQKLERYDQASEIYERLTFLPPVNEDVYYNLGLVYGRQGKLALAHFNLGMHFAKLRKREKALFHFEKARELAEGNPELREKIDKMLAGLKRP
jgi:predicted Zn-dependent protease